MSIRSRYPVRIAPVIPSFTRASKLDVSEGNCLARFARPYAAQWEAIPSADGKAYAGSKRLAEEQENGQTDEDAGRGQQHAGRDERPAGRGQLPAASPDHLQDILTKREYEVALLIGRGMSNKEIANVLNISEHTVKNHVANIFNKLNVTDRGQLAALTNRPV